VVFVAMTSLVVVGLGAAIASIDATLRFNTLYAITDRQVIVLSWQWRHGGARFSCRWRTCVTTRR
jgi:hypothetical protein